jgi:nitrous oxide reductase accessory protein NosL
MFVAKYPDWTAMITFKDSSRLYFDGPKDLLTYFFHIKKYSPKKSQTDIAMIQVKDYYSLAFVDGQKAYYVTGSDVYGPMGNELIPFDQKADAEEFLRDHKGKMIVKFHEITPERIKAME